LIIVLNYLEELSFSKLVIFLIKLLQL